MEAISTDLQAEQDKVKQEPVKEITLSYLFFTFFKIGLVSFGGHMALISVMQRIMVDKDKTIDNETILNSIGIASLLPGPLAVNVVGQTGYYLKKGKGALVSTVAIILPAFLLMLLLSWAYISHQQTFNWNVATSYIAGAVSAIILTSGLQLYKKELGKNLKKTLIFFAALVIMLFTSNYFITIALLLAGGITGILLEVADEKSKTIVDIKQPGTSQQSTSISLLNRAILLLLMINQVLFFSSASKYIETGYFKIILIFTGISLSLFGGGYVMIPIMETLFVQDLHWLSSKEFINAIAFSQATPGPILISATFIGYKVAGLGGALLATIAIFAPSVFLNVMVSKISGKYQNNRTIKNMMGGIKSVVVGLIVVSAYKIIAHENLDVMLISTILVSFILSYKYQISPVFLILGAVLLGIIYNLI